MKRMFAAATALALASSIAIAQGYGPGMMRGHDGGPGMMGGYGSGSGMMGNGPGMMAGGGPTALNLSEEQQAKIFAIHEDHRRKNFDTMSKLRGEVFQLRRMYNAESIDAKALVEQQKKVDELRRQMLASRLDMHKQVQSVLTPEQRKQMRQFGPWWAGEEND
ncbi:MAG TPA: Spy/CpxP family protein refolding chaperone [Burkholderiales bacterium]|nr:Spy/CpxP family protein refolding chaperone [Burkholderiales bacterium]